MFCSNTKTTHNSTAEQRRAFGVHLTFGCFQTGPSSGNTGRHAVLQVAIIIGSNGAA